MKIQIKHRYTGAVLYGWRREGRGASEERMSARVYILPENQFLLVRDGEPDTIFALPSAQDAWRPEDFVCVLRDVARNIETTAANEAVPRAKPLKATSEEKARARKALARKGLL
jgi:hypothetical protein